VSPLLGYYVLVVTSITLPREHCFMMTIKASIQCRVYYTLIEEEVLYGLALKVHFSAESYSNSNQTHLEQYNQY